MSRPCSALLFIGVVLLSLPAIPALAGEKTGQPMSREFEFNYGATITKLKPGQTAKIWIPVAATNEYQKVAVLSKKLPGKVQQTKDDTYGDEMFFTEAKANAKGEIHLEIAYKVKRSQVLGDDKENVVNKDLIQRFLQPDAKVPIKGKPLTLVEGKKLPKDEFKLGKRFFDIVNDHMEYKKVGTGWGQGDSNWACDSGYGNCTDFHSLFISLARGYKVPAKFVIGFGLPAKHGMGTIGGYHCWAWFKPKGHGWVPVDISQANQVKKDNPKLAAFLFGNLTEDRVVFSTGRDITLSPRQAGGPLNFFIYPYVEVDGQPYPAANIEKHFSYKDL